MLAIVDQLRRTLGMAPASEDVSRSGNSWGEGAVSPATHVQRIQRAAEGASAGATVLAAEAVDTEKGSSVQGFGSSEWDCAAASQAPEPGEIGPRGTDRRAISAPEAAQSCDANGEENGIRKCSAAAGSGVSGISPQMSPKAVKHINGSLHRDQKPPFKRGLQSHHKAALAHERRNGDPVDSPKPVPGTNSTPEDTEAAAMAAAVAASAAASWRFEARVQSLEAQMQSLARSSSQEKVSPVPHLEN